MKIALIGASGFVGRALVDEALARRHEVTALVRRPERIPSRPGLVAKRCNALSTPELSRELVGQEVLVSAYSPGIDHPEAEHQFGQAGQALLDAMQAANGVRLLVVGGAGTLEVSPGKLLLETPDFPGRVKPVALGTGEVLRRLRESQGVDWTFLSPSARLETAEKTGSYRLGTDQLLVDCDGKSHISLQDFALAVVDELERPAHRGRRFTVGY